MKGVAEEIKVKQVQIQDDFWSQIQECMIDVVIPFQERVLHDEVPGVEKSHAVENFKIAAGLSQGAFYGMVFQDSDVAKWLEGVAYSLEIKPDIELEKRADEIIDIIEKAQQPDGYLNTFFTIKEPEYRWQNLQECHELYCAGHMMEAATAYYQATGKDKLLRVMERMADHIVSRFGEGKERGIPGHQEIEIGLMKLYRATGKKQFKDMVRFFIDERGKDSDYFANEKKKRGWTHWGDYPVNMAYSQAHVPVYEQKEAVGHSVRAVYMYTAMADLAATEGDERLFKACQTLWDNIVHKKMYITGGIGATVEGEAFSIAYDLPNDMAYAETCASIAMVFFAKKMLENNVDGTYTDIMERQLYNGTISGMQLDGKRFFYVNPLEVNPGISGKVFGYKHVLPTRPGWYACACCPPNLVRMVTSLGSYAWSESDDTIYSHLYLGQKVVLKAADITVESKYPWEGKVQYDIEPKKEDFTLAIHIPGYIDIKSPETSVMVNSEKIDLNTNLKKGYLYLTRKWNTGDRIEIIFDMPIRKVFANSKVIENAGCVALMRGPIVYCFEGVDNGEELQSLRIAKDMKVESYRCTEGILKGNVLLELSGYRVKTCDSLYFEERPTEEETTLTAIPYYAWGNRGENQMRVWMLEK